MVFKQIYITITWEHEHKLESHLFQHEIQVRFTDIQVHGTEGTTSGD